MNVLLSIKPEFAEKIFSGEKLYEFRKSIFKNSSVNKIIVYVSAPTKMVLGEFTFSQILHDEVSVLWEKTKEHSGITEDFYLDYFSKKECAYAIKIDKVVRYKRARSLKEYNVNFPPQSFMYIA